MAAAGLLNDKTSQPRSFFTAQLGPVTLTAEPDGDPSKQDTDMLGSCCAAHLVFPRPDAAEPRRPVAASPAPLPPAPTPPAPPLPPSPPPPVPSLPSSPLALAARAVRSTKTSSATGV